jgi:hypothetical protein
VKEKKTAARNWWQRQNERNPPAEYDECYLRALRRMAVTLNCGSPNISPFKPAVLAKSDPELADIFSRKKIGSVAAGAALVNYEVISREEEVKEFDQAENLFYGDFDFGCPRGFRNITRVTHRSTPTFRNWSFRRLVWPTVERDQGPPERLEKRSDETDAEFMMSCASNYLLKNFWHNFVHRRIQGITSHNYHSFGGEARDQSDFTADNIGTVLHIRSYGFTLPAAGRSTSARSTGVRDLLRRNRCNLVFAERDRLRIERTAALSVHERWEEAQWQFRRRVAAAISNRLLERGAVVTSLAVYLRGERRTREGWFFHDRNVVVQLNGHYLVCNHVPYIPDPAEDFKPHTRTKSYARREEVAESAVGQYVSLLDQNKEIRAHARVSLNALSTRIGVPLSKES